MVQQRLEDLGILTRITLEGQLQAMLAPDEIGVQQVRQLQAVIFRFRGRRGDLIDWLESCWTE